MDRLGYVILYVFDLTASIAFALGVSILSGPADRPWGHRTVHVADPDGFVVEFAQDIPRRRPRPGGQGLTRREAPGGGQ